jgi:putative transposase
MGGALFGVVLDIFQLLRIDLLSRTRLAAENLFLRKQLALYIERGTKPRRASNATRLTLVLLARFIEWRPLTIVQPDSLVRWHRNAFSPAVAVPVSPARTRAHRADPLSR